MSEEEDTIFLNVGNRSIKCSKNVLKSNSRYFKALCGINKRNISEVKDVDPDAMDELLEILNGTKQCDQVSNMFNVLLICDMFLFDQIKNNLAREFIKTLNQDNCLELWMKLRSTSVFPLVWKAKSMSLTSFDHQRLQNLINPLKLSDLIVYLGHANLMCKREIDVFHAMLQWISKNSGVENMVDLKKLLESVINFKDISISELREMICHPMIENHSDIVKILENIIKVKSGLTVLDEDSCADTARCWLNVRGRYLPKYLCVLDTSIHHKFELFCHGDYKDPTMIRISVLPDSIKDLSGFEIQIHNMSIYIIGGEFTIGSGCWNDKIYMFDLITEKLVVKKRNCTIKRRHFKSCLIGDILYIIGGTGPFRIKENNIIYYDFSTEILFPKKIELPCASSSVRCCNFRDQLFLLDIYEKCAYFFDHDEMNFRKVTIQMSIQPEDFSTFSIFPYKNNLFLKGKKLIELEYTKETLIPINEHEIEKLFDGSLIKAVACENIVYSTYMDDYFSGVVRLEWMNLDNLSQTKRFENILLHCYCGRDKNKPFCKLRYDINSHFKIFMYHHYKLIETVDLLKDAV